MRNAMCIAMAAAVLALACYETLSAQGARWWPGGHSHRCTLDRGTGAGQSSRRSHGYHAADPLERGDTMMPQAPEGSPRPRSKPGLERAIREHRRAALVV